jgi:hypothetical protein
MLATIKNISDTSECQNSNNDNSRYEDLIYGPEPGASWRFINLNPRSHLIRFLKGAPSDSLNRNLTSSWCTSKTVTGSNLWYECIRVITVSTGYY